MRRLKTIFAATRDALALLGLAAAAGFYAAERSWLWLLPATLLVCGVWYCCWRIRGIFTASKQVKITAPTPREAHSSASRASEFQRPPRSARYTYTLTEAGVPVGVEWDRRAVDNWLALGDEHDAIAHFLPRAPLAGSHGRPQDLARPA